MLKPQRFIRIVFLIALFTISRTEGETYQEDLDNLADIKQLVNKSALNLRGWGDPLLDPCGDTVPCGINHLDDCNWEGIACVNEEIASNVPSATPVYQRIIGIEIQGQSPEHRLRGHLPLRLPPGIRSIALPNNALSGNLSNLDCAREFGCSDIWWMNDLLTDINLEGNDLEGPLPEWKTLQRLESIRLSRNRLRGTLPYSWSEKVHLSRIELSQNGFSGRLPTGWANLAAVQFIRLAQNALENRIPSEWLRLPSLVLLDVAGNCGICGEIPKQDAFAIYGNGTNLNTECSQCNGCKCHNGQLQFVLTNVLLSIAVLAIMCFVWFIYRCCKKEEAPQQLPLCDFVTQSMPRKPQENPTIVINPDHDVCICCPIVEEEGLTTDPEEEEGETESESYSEGGSSEYSSFSDTKSIDPRVLAFLYKKGPMLAQAERTWSAELAGPSEVRAEGYASDGTGRPGSAGLRHRRSKSALEGSSEKKLSRDFIDSRKSAKRVTDLSPSPQQPVTPTCHITSVCDDWMSIEEQASKTARADIPSTESQRPGRRFHHF